MDSDSSDSSVYTCIENDSENDDALPEGEDSINVVQEDISTLTSGSGGSVLIEYRYQPVLPAADSAVPVITQQEDNQLANRIDLDPTW